MRITAVIAQFNDLRETELIGWIERGWVRPAHAEPEWVFQDIDVARVRLIYDLSHTMALAEETIPMVLSLVDQVYGLRGRLQAMLRAVEQQPEPVRRAIMQAMER